MSYNRCSPEYFACEFKRRKSKFLLLWLFDCAGSFFNTFASALLKRWIPLNLLVANSIFNIEEKWQKNPSKTLWWFCCHLRLYIQLFQNRKPYHLACCDAKPITTKKMCTKIFYSFIEVWLEMSLKMFLLLIIFEHKDILMSDIDFWAVRLSSFIIRYNCSACW